MDYFTMKRNTFNIFMLGLIGVSLLLVSTSQYVYAQRDSMKATSPESEDSIDSIITAAPGDDNQVLSGSDTLTAIPGDEESTIYVRASAIIGLVPNEGFTTVNVQGDGVMVSESPEEILELINKAGFRSMN